MRQRFSDLTRLAMLGMALLLALPATANADASGLLSSLTSQLGVSEEQASGGVGAIFDYAKNNLSADDFATVASGIPGMDGLLSKAPEVAADSGLMGAATSMLGDSGGTLGGIASLAGSFEALGLDADMVSQFLPVVYDYVGGASGADAMGLLKGLF